MTKLELLQKLIDVSDNIVILTGAGFSTASNIPDFRSDNGLYKVKGTSIPPEEILSHHFFISHPDEFFKYYFSKMVYMDALPNAGHKKLAELESNGKNITIITQNIDGLHQKAGSKHVLELHGSVRRNHCMKCHKYYALEEIPHDGSIPYCTCGGIIKPDVVLYEEGLDEKVIDESLRKIVNADLLIISGSSMVVNPAASLPYYYRGNKMVIINLSETPLDSFASLIIREKSEEVFSKIVVKGETK